MKKNTSLIFILSLFFFLYVITFFYKINGKYFFDYQIRFFSLNDFVVKKSNIPVTKKIKTATIKSDSFQYTFYESKSNELLNSYVDTLIAQSKLDINEVSLKESKFLINQPINGVYPLDPFYDNLFNNDSSHILYRVAHYGDSQTEGDRMTHTLRKLFQSRFSGSGVGYIPMADVTDPISYIRHSDASWNRYTVFSNKLKGFAYGPGGSTYRYAPFLKASMSLNLFSPYKKAYLLYGFGNDTSTLDIYSSANKLISSYTLHQKSFFNRILLNIPSQDTRLNFVFRGPSPCIYGISFDTNTGIQFDNYGLRGQAGDGLLLISNSQLTQMLEQTNTGTAILQYGGNVVPGLKNDKMLQFYGEVYKKLYLHFKKALSMGSVFIIGVNDVSRSINGEYKSYPNISELRYLQRKIAVENGMAFFDIYQLMGGENSIKVWAEKGLASRDGHYSDRGREIVCKEIYKALIAEYLKYLKRKSLKIE